MNEPYSDYFHAICFCEERPHRAADGEEISTCDMRAASDMGWRTHLPEASRESTTVVVDAPCAAAASSAPAWGVVDDAGAVEDEPFVGHGASETAQGEIESDVMGRCLLRSFARSGE